MGEVTQRKSKTYLRFNSNDSHVLSHDGDVQDNLAGTLKGDHVLRRKVG
jgi:hypothetical protein